MADKKIVFFAKEECYCGVIEFYNLIAQKLGYDPNKVGYDRYKIDVTKPVQEQIFAFYQEEQKVFGEFIVDAWYSFGPKANLPGKEYRAEIFDGFIAAKN